MNGHRRIKIKLNTNSNTEKSYVGVDSNQNHPYDSSQYRSDEGSKRSRQHRSRDRSKSVGSSSDSRKRKKSKSTVENQHQNTRSEAQWIDTFTERTSENFSSVDLASTPTCSTYHTAASTALCSNREEKKQEVMGIVLECLQELLLKNTINGKSLAEIVNEKVTKQLKGNDLQSHERISSNTSPPTSNSSLPSVSSEQSPATAEPSKLLNEESGKKAILGELGSAMTQPSPSIELPPPPPPPESADELAPPPPPPPPPSEPVYEFPPPPPPPEPSIMNSNGSSNPTIITGTSGKASSKSEQTIQSMEIEDQGVATNSKTLPSFQLPIGSYFSFSIDGMYAEAEQMEQRKNAQSPEEWMALVVGPKAELAERTRRQELEKRLNREAVISRKKLMQMKVCNPPCDQSVITREIIDMDNTNDSEKPRQDIQTEATDFDEHLEQNAQQKDKVIVIEHKWILRPIDGLAIPFSWKSFLQKMRSDSGQKNRVSRNLFSAAEHFEVGDQRIENKQQMGTSEQPQLEEGEIGADEEEEQVWPGNMKENATEREEMQFLQAELDQEEMASNFLAQDDRIEYSDGAQFEETLDGNSQMSYSTLHDVPYSPIPPTLVAGEALEEGEIMDEESDPKVLHNQGEDKETSNQLQGDDNQTEEKMEQSKEIVKEEERRKEDMVSDQPRGEANEEEQHFRHEMQHSQQLKQIPVQASSIVSVGTSTAHLDDDDRPITPPPSRRLLKRSRKKKQVAEVITIDD